MRDLFTNLMIFAKISGLPSPFQQERSRKRFEHPPIGYRVLTISNKCKQRTLKKNKTSRLSRRRNRKH